MRKALVNAARFLICLLALSGFVAAEVRVPALAKRVTDLTGTLTSQQSASLERYLKDYEASRGSQVVVLIVPSTKPEEIEEYSIRVAEQWKLGRRGIDDGVLLLVAKGDRRLRIEVGYGLEGILPDAVCKRIIEEIITPRFRSGDYFGGIQAGLKSITGVIAGEPLPPPRQASPAESGILVMIVFVVIFTMIMPRSSMLHTAGRYGAGRRRGCTGWSSSGSGGFSGGGGGFGGGGASGGW